MNHFSVTDKDVPAWPIGKFVVVKFPFYGDEEDFVARAAMLRVSTKLKLRIEKAATQLASNITLRTIQFYWPMEIVTNEVLHQPILRNYARAIRELLNANFQEAIPDTVGRDAIRRVAHLDSATWISVGRPNFGTYGARVEIGCTQLYTIDFSTCVEAITSEVKVPSHDRPENEPRRVIRAINNLHDATVSDEAKKP